jgi:hypothetical protein
LRRLLRAHNGTNNNWINKQTFVCLQVRRSDLPPDSLDPVPEQLIDGVNQDIGQGFAELPECLEQALRNAGTFHDNQGHVDSKRQVITGLEDIIADYLAPALP